MEGKDFSESGAVVPPVTEKLADCHLVGRQQGRGSRQPPRRIAESLMVYRRLCRTALVPRQPGANRPLGAAAMAASQRHCVMDEQTPIG
jgi:hypothetical protein